MKALHRPSSGVRVALVAVRHPDPASETLVPPSMVPELGMRRVRWVRISVSDAGVRADVAGIAHRFPIVRRVPLQWAHKLIRAGCPYVIRRQQSPAEGA